MANPYLLLLRWKIEAHAWLESVWEGRWSGIALTSMGAVACGLLVWKVPAPGVSVAVLGAAAALMTARTKATGAEKAVWMLIISCLLVIEMLAIRKDRKENNDRMTALLTEEITARSEAKVHFESIGGGIKGTIEQSQKHFDTTMAGMKSLLETTQETKKNTEPEAYVKFSKFEVLSSSLPLASDHQLMVNIDLENTGSEDATSLIQDAKIFVGKYGDPKDERRLSQEFEKWWQHPEHRHWERKVYAAGEKTGFFTIKAPSLVPDDIRQIQDNKLTLYIFFRGLYSDHSGRWAHDKCSWLQNLGQGDFAVTRPCSVNDNPRHKVKRP